jgi:dimethylhistidine N-methyltransferase
LYDQQGSELFDQICEVDDYYLTRTELQIMRDNIADMSRELSAAAWLVEPGSGSSLKTRLLIEYMRELQGYVPVDISREHLLATAKQLGKRYPQLPIQPLHADFTQPFQLPAKNIGRSEAVVYFPGSTIGNFHRHEASELLDNWRRLAKSTQLLIGIDLKKSPQILEAAYDDSQGVTASFSLNLLDRINRELDGDFDVEHFEHRAVYNDQLGRIEIDIISSKRQTISLGHRTYEFAAGEPIRTEHAYKYTIDDFASLAAQSGWKLRAEWTDRAAKFAVLLFSDR